MILKKIARAVVFGWLAILLLVLIFLVISIAPVDRTPASAFESYHQMEAALDHLNIGRKSATTGFSVGCATVNITPSQPMPTAGYGNRKGKLFTGILDSIYVRTLVIT